MNLWCCVFCHLAATIFGRKNNPASCPAVAPKPNIFSHGNLSFIAYSAFFPLFFFNFCPFCLYRNQDFVLCVTRYCEFPICNVTTMAALVGLAHDLAPLMSLGVLLSAFPLIFLLMLIIPMIDFFYQCQSGWYLHYLHKYGIFLTQYTFLMEHMEYGT